MDKERSTYEEPKSGICRSLYLGDTVGMDTVMDAGKKGIQKLRAKINEIYIQLSHGRDRREKATVCIGVIPIEKSFGVAVVGYKDMNKLEMLMKDLEVRTSVEMVGKEVLLYEVDEFPGRVLGLSATEEIQPTPQD